MVLETHEAEQSTTFFEILQNSQSLDLRDNRGKIHEISVVLIGVLIAIFRGRDGNLSRIHRSMVNTHDSLLIALKVEEQLVISRSHLPILLKKVCVETFSSLVFEHFGLVLSDAIKAWFAVDGKELRGTILTGATRGEAIIQAVSHDNKMVYCQGYYNGNKESERPAVTDLLRKSGLSTQGITLDALHFTPKTLSCIAESGGNYIVGLKENQLELYNDMKQLFTIQNTDYQYVTDEKAHGRAETRQYKMMDVSNEFFDKRWQFADFKTVIEVRRTRLNIKTGKFSDEFSYYMSNCKAGSARQARQISDLIRQHWSVEVNNHIRDVSFKEDALQTIFKAIAQSLSIVRTLIINILQKQKIKNVSATLDNFADNFNRLILFLKSVKVL